MSKIEVGAYFYPLSQYCTERRYRATSIGESLGIAQPEVPNELQLAQEAQPLFEGHKQPRTYCLMIGGKIKTTWDDIESTVFNTQVALAAAHGLSYFLFDTYHGLRNGEPVKELSEANRIASRAMKSLGPLGFKYARMETLESPRAVLPAPNKGNLKRGFAGGFAEPGRSYDITPQTARFIVDRNIDDWRTSSYLRVQERPYLAIMMPNFLDVKSDAVKQRTLNNFIEEIQEYAFQKYRMLPYLVGVMRQPSDIAIWYDAYMDAVTQYCALQDNSPKAPPVQYYGDLIAMREKQWYQLYETTKDKTRSMTFLPTAAAGWDASPRGEQGYQLEEVEGLHPYTPIVVDNTPTQVGRFLGKAIDFTKKTVDEGEQKVTIFAWNEVGEGGTLLPQLLPDGTVDYSYLEAVSKVIHEKATCNLCAISSTHRDNLNTRTKKDFL